MKVLLIIVLVVAVVLMYMDAYSKGYKDAMEKVIEITEDVIGDDINKVEDETGNNKQDS